MKRCLASAFAVMALLATTGMVAAGANGSEEAAEQKAVMHIAGHSATSIVSASANRNSTFATNEAATAVRGDDPESLRMELVGSLLIMLIVTVGALLGICYFEHRTARRGLLSTNRGLAKPRTG